MLSVPKAKVVLGWQNETLFASFTNFWFARPKGKLCLIHFKQTSKILNELQVNTKLRQIAVSPEMKTFLRDVRFTAI